MEVGLLVGSLTSFERAAVLQDLADGTLDMVVGTHALFSKDVNYAYLGLAIIDEQHKFGVNQRSLLVNKGDNADLLLMSATPIPRTLALTIYGDLDVSSLTSFPSGKRKVVTSLVDKDDPSILSSINASINSHHRVYIVAPQIEEGAKDDTSAKIIYAHYSKLFPNKVTLLHGKMDEESKQAAFLAFKTGLCPILVATSLIEVGIDVKPANLMIIYSPTHFALSSLHQLRGRIGRDGSEAKCILIKEGEEDEMAKLDILLKSDDGFKIAEEDMRLRGPGEIAGTRQSGLPDFNYANIIDDFKIFECARDDASYMLAHQDELTFAPLLERATKEAKGYLSA
jgi:ATP-dependent DNA helicase RecG